MIFCNPSHNSTKSDDSNHGSREFIKYSSPDPQFFDKDEFLADWVVLFEVERETSENEWEASVEFEF